MKIKDPDKYAEEVLEIFHEWGTVERKIFMDRITNEFCKDCWTNDPRCQCWNDE